MASGVRSALRKQSVVDLSFQPSTFRPSRAFFPSKRSKVTIVIQPIHDSRFTSVLPPIDPQIQQRYTQFPPSSFFSSAALTRIGILLRLASHPRGGFSPLFSFNVSHDRVYTGNLWREYRDFAVDNRRSVISAAISRVVRPRGRNAPYDSLLIPVPLRLSKIDRRSYRRIVARLIMLLSFRFEVWMLRVHRWTGNVFTYFY